MTFQQLLTSLQEKKYRPIYFLHGNEPYFIDAISGFIEKNALPESEKSFNQVILYGKETDHLTIIDHARRYPMMSPFQVVIVKEAQEIKELKELERYVEKPLLSTILVICHKYKSFNLNSKFGKLLQANAVVFESKKLYDNQVPDWVHDYAAHLNLKISPDAANLMAEYLGTDLSVVAHELDKLSVHLQPGAKIETSHVEQHVGISREYNVFELQKAIAQGEKNKVSRIVQNFRANPKRNPFIMVNGSLANFFAKVYQFHFVKNASDADAMKALNLRSAYGLREYRQAARLYPLAKTEEIISILREYDLKSKGVDFNAVGKEEGELLSEMIWRVTH